MLDYVDVSGNPVHRMPLLIQRLQTKVSSYLRPTVLIYLLFYKLFLQLYEGDERGMVVSLKGKKPALSFDFKKCTLTNPHLSYKICR